MTVKNVCIHEKNDQRIFEHLLLVSSNICMFALEHKESISTTASVSDFYNLLLLPKITTNYDQTHQRHHERRPWEASG